MMVEHGEKAGFVVPEAMSLRNHYIKTLGMWADALERNREAAIAATDEEKYDQLHALSHGLPVLLHRREPSTSAWSPI